MNYEQLMSKTMSKRTFLTSLLGILVMTLILPKFSLGNNEQSELSKHIKIIED